MKGNLNIFKENNLDKCIRMNFKMVDNEIAIAATMAVLMAFCLATLWLAVLCLIPIIVTAVYTFKMYKKLFYTSVYGETAATYQSLPASAAEMTAAKIFVAGLGSIISTLAYIIVFVVLLFNYGSSLMRDIVDLLDMGNLTYTLPLGVLSVVIAAFAQSALIFLAVAAYNSVVRERRKGLYRFLIVIAAYCVNLLLGNSGRLLEKLGIESLVIPSVVGIVLGIAVMVLCYRRTVKLMEERYEWG